MCVLSPCCLFVCLFGISLQVQSAPLRRVVFWFLVFLRRRVAALDEKRERDEEINLTDTDSSKVITRGMGVGEVEEDKGG